MTFVQDGNPTNKVLPSGINGINYNKQRYYAIPVFFLKRSWGSDYQFELNLELINNINQLKVNVEIDDIKLFTLSSISEAE